MKYDKYSTDQLSSIISQLQLQYGLLLKWIDVAVLEVDREGIITEANDKALDILGWSLEELKGKNCHETIHYTLEDGSEYPWEFCPMFAALEDGSAHHVDGDVFWKKDGSSFSSDFIINAIRDENNTITGARLLFKNITASKMEEAKRVHNVKLQSIGELAAGIAHEINTPMQFIGSNLTFLEDGFNDLYELLTQYKVLLKHSIEKEFSQETTETISQTEEDIDLEFLEEELPSAVKQTKQGVEQVTKLVLGLKGFAHSNENTKELTDINEIIHNTLIVSNNEYKYCADIELDLSQIPPVKVSPGDIAQVLLNLVVNAAHAIQDKNKESGQRGIITITTKETQDSINIAVADTGQGIDPKVADRIFDPFFTTKDVGKGSGQGLAISRNIIKEKHGGELVFTSEKDKGTTFTITLGKE